MLELVLIAGLILALRRLRRALIIPSTSLSVSDCSTGSATARRKSPSPAFFSKIGQHQSLFGHRVLSLASG